MSGIVELGFNTVNGATSMVIPAFTPTAKKLMVAVLTGSNAANFASITGHADGNGWVDSGRVIAESGTILNGHMWVAKASDTPASAVLNITFTIPVQGTVTIFEVQDTDDTKTALQCLVQGKVTSLTNVAFPGGNIGDAFDSAFSSALNKTVIIGLSGGSEVTYTAVAPIVLDYARTVAGGYEVTVGSFDGEVAQPQLNGSANVEDMGVMAFEVAVASPSITATEGQTNVPVGQDPGFTGNVNGINLKTADDSFSMVLSFGGTNAAPTFNMPDLANTAYETAWCPYASASYTQLQIEVTSDDPGDTPLVVNLTRNLLAGYSVVELSGVPATPPRGNAFYQIAAPEVIPNNGSQIIYPTANNTVVSADGTVTTDQNGGTLNGWLFRADTGNIEAIQILVPGQESASVSGNPATVDPSTAYDIVLVNFTIVPTEVVFFDSGDNPHQATINSMDVTGGNVTTPASLPAASVTKIMAGGDTP